MLSNLLIAAAVLRGPFPLLCTPYTEKGEVDYAVLAKEAAFVADCGANGVIWPAADDALKLLTPEEERRGWTAIAGVLKGRDVWFCPCCPGTNVTDQLRRLRDAESAGQKAGAPLTALVRMVDDATDDAAYEAQYEQVAAAFRHPVIIQTFNGKTPMPSMKLMIDLARRFPETYGWFKVEGSDKIISEKMSELLAAQPDVKTVFTGWGGRDWLYQYRRIGTRGVISQRPMYADLMVKVWEALEANDPRADDLFAKFMYLRNLDNVIPSANMRGWNLQVLKRRGIFTNTLSREPQKDGTWKLADLKLTAGMKAEVDRRLAYALGLPPAPCAVLDLKPGVGNSRNSEGDFAVLKDGRILFVYSKFIGGNGGDHDRCVLAARVSSDRGETWSGDRIVVVNEDDPEGNVMSVSLLRLRDGRLAVFYGQKGRDERGRMMSRMMMRTSSDEGATWSKPSTCTANVPTAYRVLNNSRIIRLKSGRILMPLAEHEIRGTGDYDLNPAARLSCLYSDDDGASWKLSAFVAPARTAEGRTVAQQEPGVIELSDGRVMMWCRTDEGRQWLSHSSDGGQTWGACEPSSMHAPLSPATVRRLSSGAWLGVWNDHEGRSDLKHAGPDWAKGVRTPLTVGLSTDEGKTWPVRKNLEDGFDPKDPFRHWYCYTAVLELDDRLLLAYCAEDNLRHLRITSLPKSWLPVCVPTCVQKPLKIGLFVDRGCAGNGLALWAELIEGSPDAELVLLSGKAIAGGGLKGLDLLVMPGGRGDWQYTSLGDAGAQAIRDYVANGGKYFGTCCGIAIALNEDNLNGFKRLRMLPFKRVMAPNRGGFTATVDFNGKGAAYLGLPKGKRKIRYHNGPVLQPADAVSGCTNVEVLATMDCELAQVGSVVGRMYGTPAAVRARYGKGEMLAFNCHPEAHADSVDIVQAGIRALTGRTFRLPPPRSPKGCERVGFRTKELGGKVRGVEKYLLLAKDPSVYVVPLTEDEIREGHGAAMDRIVSPEDLK